MFPTSPVPTNAYAYYPNRPIRGIGLHHTAGPSMPTWRVGSSTNFAIDRDPPATIYQSVPLSAAAHTILRADKWRPSWMLRCPDGRVSDPNYCMVNIEIVYAPQAPFNQVPTDAQYLSLRTLLEYIYSIYGPLPIVGHGELQSDKWPTEPHPWPSYYVGRLNLSSKNAYGRFLLTPPPPAEGDNMDPISDEDLKAYLEQLGTPVNLQTALIQRAALAYRRGERRGPAISGEYDYQGKVRQRFTAATAEYDPATGGVNWVELNVNPEE